MEKCKREFSYICQCFDFNLPIYFVVSNLQAISSGKEQNYQGQKKCAY